MSDLTYTAPGDQSSLFVGRGMHNYSPAANNIFIGQNIAANTKTDNNILICHNIDGTGDKYCNWKWCSHRSTNRWVQSYLHGRDHPSDAINY